MFAIKEQTPRARRYDPVELKRHREWLRDYPLGHYLPRKSKVKWADQVRGGELIQPPGNHVPRPRRGPILIKSPSFREVVASILAGGNTPLDKAIIPGALPVDPIPRWKTEPTAQMKKVMPGDRPMPGDIPGSRYPVAIRHHFPADATVTAAAVADVDDTSQSPATLDEAWDFSWTTFACMVDNFADAWRAFLFWLLALPFVLIARLWEKFVAAPIRGLDRRQLAELRDNCVEEFGALSVIISVATVAALPFLVWTLGRGLKWGFLYLLKTRRKDMELSEQDSNELRDNYEDVQRWVPEQRDEEGMRKGGS